MTDKQPPLFSQSSFNSIFLRWLKEADIPCWQSLFIVLLCACLTAISLALIPLVIGQLSIHTSSSGNRLFLHELPLLLAILILTAVLANQAVNYTLQRLQGQLALILRDKLLSRIVNPTPNRTEVSAESIRSRYFAVVDHLLYYLIELTKRFSRDLLITIGLIATLLYINQELALLTLMVLTIALLTQPWFQTSKVFHALSGTVQDEIVSRIQNMMTHHYLIQLDHGNLQENLNIHDMFKQQHDASLKRTGRFILTGIFIQLFLVGLVTALLYFWLQQMELGKFLPGEMAAFISALLLLILPFKRLLASKYLLVGSHQSCQSITTLLDNFHAPAPAPVEAESYHSSTNKTRRLQGVIQFKEVHFYRDAVQSSLPQRLNFMLTPGEKLAITNFTPDCAQTLAALVCGFTPPTAGRVLLDEEDAIDLDLPVRQANIVWLSPDRKLLSNSVAANIAYGVKRCSTESEITRAARLSHATEFIRELPHGYETRLDTHSNIVLTASQQQRLLIARALLKNPVIVIIDESTAQFDLEDLLLRRAILTLTEKRTTLILSSQPALLNFAERSIAL